MPKLHPTKRTLRCSRFPATQLLAIASALGLGSYNINSQSIAQEPQIITATVQGQDGAVIQIAPGGQAPAQIQINGGQLQIQGVQLQIQNVQQKPSLRDRKSVV